MLGVSFIAQYPVGRYSVDFALVEPRIALEVDGDYWHRASARRDARRDRALLAMGWRTVRLAERDVEQSPDLLGLIRERLDEVSGAEQIRMEPSPAALDEVIGG